MLGASFILCVISPGPPLKVNHKAADRLAFTGNQDRTVQPRHAETNINKTSFPHVGRGCEPVRSAGSQAVFFHSQPPFFSVFAEREKQTPNGAEPFFSKKSRQFVRLDLIWDGGFLIPLCEGVCRKNCQQANRSFDLSSHGMGRKFRVV